MEIGILIKGERGMEKKQHDQPSSRALSNSKSWNYGLNKV
jgi:hypothetical protein